MEAQLETEIQAKGLTAPRVTPAQIDSVISQEFFFTAQEGVEGALMLESSHAKGTSHESLRLLTFCVLVLVNGFTVTGEFACASPENFDAEIGRRIARENARQKVWALEGYLLKEDLYRDYLEKSE
jgi:hypothetical protein